MKAKYVMIDRGPILFPLGIQHEVFRNLKPTSAGFVDFDENGKVYVYGKSQSLDLIPHEFDKVMIEIAFEER